MTSLLHTITRRLNAALDSGSSDTRRTTLSGDAVTGVQRWRRGFAFGPQVRAEVWQLIADVVEAGVSLEDALETLIEGYLRTGRRRRALVIAEMRAALLAGTIGARLAPYTSPPERLILDGLGHQDAHVVFGSAARLLRNRLALRKALSGALAMPLLLLAGLIGLVLFFGLQLLPALAVVVDLEGLAGPQGMIVRATQAFSAHPTRLFIGLAGGAATLIVLMRTWTGRGRALADRVPPFSVVRMMAGTGFLFAVIEYGRTGTAVTPTLLERMARATGRYEASRIRALAAAMERVEGANLGAAALLAGQGFPDDDLCVVLRVLWNRENGIERAGVFLERRLEQIEASVKARMAVLNAALLVAVAVTLLALMSVGLPIIDLINASSGAY